MTGIPDGGLKVAVLAVLGLVVTVIVYFRGYHVAGVAAGVATFAGVWLEGLPKAARARRRAPQ